MCAAESEDDFELNPPSPERVAKRAFALAAVVCRSGIEQGEFHSAAEDFRRDVLRWLTDARVTDELEPEERVLLETPLGSLTERQEINASWRGEGLAVLAWALKRFELPAYDQIVSPPDVADALGFLTNDGYELLAAPELRAPEEIDHLAELMLAAHWRLRQFSIDGLPMEYAVFAQTCYFGPLETRGLRFVDGDLAIGERAISKVQEAEWREVLSIVRERQQAANWLTGQDPIYSEVTCDT